MGLITQEAEVIRQAPGRAWVKPCSSEGCSSCSLSGACGQGLLARWFASSQPLLEIETTCPLQVGDRVELAVDAAVLNRAAWLQFALPLATLVVASLIAEFLGFTEVIQQLAFAALGLGSGLLLARHFAGRAKPYLKRRLASTELE